MLMSQGGAFGSGGCWGAVRESSGRAGMFDSETNRRVLGGGGETTGLGESGASLWSCIPFEMAILTGRE